MKKILRYPVIVLLFGVVIFFFVINLVTPAKGFSEMENRYLSQLPSFSFKGIIDSSERDLHSVLNSMQTISLLCVTGGSH